jgi:hypothetical protein
MIVQACFFIFVSPFDLAQLPWRLKRPAAFKFVRLLD